MNSRRTTQQPKRLALIVLGMHRSGTSALAGALAQMGADLPQDLMPANHQNTRGFFESSTITKINDDLLASAGQHWFSYETVHPEWFASPKAAEFEERAVDALAEEYGRSHLFILKDPRICRLLPFWHRALAQAGCLPLHICTHRHPLDVASSLSHAWDHETDYALHLWLRHVLEAEGASRGQRRVFTSYDRLMADPAGTIARIGTGLDLVWPRNPASMKAAFDTFLSDGLRHFRQAGGQDALAPWFADTLAVLERWAADGEDPAGQATLDEIRAEMQRAGPVLQRPLWVLQEKRWEVKGLRDRAAALEQQLQTTRAEAAGHQANHATEQGWRGQAEDRLAETTRLLEAARAELAEGQGHTGTVPRAVQDRVAELEAALETATAALSRENQAQDALRQDRDELAAALSDLTHRHGQIESQLAQRGTENDDLHRAIAADARTIAALEAARDELAASRNSLQAQLDRKTAQMSQMTLQFARQLESFLDARLRETTTRAGEAESLAAALEAERQSLAAETANSERLTRELATLSQILVRIETEKDAEVAQASAETRRLRQSLNDLNTRLSAQNAARRDLERKLTAVHTSTSWRMTGPLRRIVRFIRRDPK